MRGKLRRGSGENHQVCRGRVFACASARAELWVTSAVLAALALAALAPRAHASSAAVSVFPTPGTRYNEPQTQITFRGIPAGDIGQVTVVGSRSGAHQGTIEADSDGNGGSFVPSEPFTPGETVTVTTGLTVLGSKSRTFEFAIANPAGQVPYGPLPIVPATRGGVQGYRTAPGLAPAAVKVTTDKAPASEGDIFVAPEHGPKQDGPMILDPRGNLIWFLPYTANTLVTDFRVQELHGQPVLTWWRGNPNAGVGRGLGEIYNSQYQPVATVSAGNGLDMDKHEFLVTNPGDAYFLAAWPVRVASSPKPLIDSVVQEVDITTGLVLFQWDALDHIPLRQSYVPTRNDGHVFDPYHANSISLDGDGNLVVSLRNTSAVYKINHQTGSIMWTLGGKASSFRMEAGTSTWGQHDALIHPGEQLTLFDNEGGLPRVKPDSRGIRLVLDLARRTARLIAQYGHSPALPSNFEGSLQPLSRGNVFIGWGQQPYFSEDNASGHELFDAHFVEPTGTYRAYRFPWSAQPPVSQLGAAVSPGAMGTIDVYASWNGATGVAYWRVLGGASPSALAPIATRPRSGFQTEIPVDSVLPYYAVQGLNSSGQPLGTSPAQPAPAHIAMFGTSAFVAPGGTSGIPAACYEPQQCRIAATVTAGRRVIAHTGTQGISRGEGAIIYFHLSRAGDAMLSRARGNRLPVRISARDASGATATATLDLIGFHTRGAGPRRATANSPTVQIIGNTDFVSAAGDGGVPAGCMLTSIPCSVVTTVSVGNTVIAHTGPEVLGANELGYLRFSLTRAGRSLLAHADGNQLGAQIQITGAGTAACASVALVAFR